MAASNCVSLTAFQLDSARTYGRDGISDGGKMEEEQQILSPTWFCEQSCPRCIAALAPRPFSWRDSWCSRLALISASSCWDLHSWRRLLRAIEDGLKTRQNEMVRICSRGAQVRAWLTAFQATPFSPAAMSTSQDRRAV